ncbi:MAG: hypothetical protein KAV41_01290 [Candidatus Pacebacteria bacterium]|nr:hypothetical protein [Candidatus Paceibacterota bacterium]
MKKKNKKIVNASLCTDTLWKGGFFKDGHSLQEVSERITKKWGHNFSPVDVSKALTNASFLRRTGKCCSFRYVQKISPVSKKVASIEEDLFSEEFISKLGKNFGTELNDLRLNFGTSGTCTAFLLRKILEKLIYIVFAQNGIGAKIEDKSFPGGLMGLEKMINIAAKEKIKGIPILTPKTAQKIKGIKFLGDVSAHNPLANVDTETIMLQVPYIITAYKELVARL